MTKKRIRKVYIDSNVWLSLYSYSKTDLDSFRQIKDLIGKKIDLLVPVQTRDEVFRNREKKFKDSFGKFEFPQITFPIYCKFYEQYVDIKKKYDSLKKEFDEWSDEIESDVINGTIYADKLISEVFQKIAFIEHNKELIARAKERFERGNPPGKNCSYGDAINWECLLETVPMFEDLYFISEDSDYCSPLDENKMNSFLNNEWKEIKHSDIHFFSSLKEFLKDCSDEMNKENSEESQKDSLINDLINSESFNETHRIIEALNGFSSFSDDQVYRLCFAVLSNNQVEWILTDSDIRSFYAKALKKEFNEINIGTIIDYVAEVHGKKPVSEEEDD